MFLCSRGKRNGEELLQSAANAGTKEHKNKSPCPYVLKFFCSYVLMFSALAAARARYGVSPYVS